MSQHFLEVLQPHPAPVAAVRPFRRYPLLGARHHNHAGKPFTRNTQLPSLKVVASGKGFSPVHNGKLGKKGKFRKKTEYKKEAEEYKVASLGDDPHEVARIVGLLPVAARDSLAEYKQLSELIEVVMDLGRLPLGRFPDLGDVSLSDQPIAFGDLDNVIRKVGEFGGDNRAGIQGTLHRISCMRNRDGEIVGVTCRVGRDIENSADLISDLVIAGRSILLMGNPGVGKTTAIRGICRILADECEKRVVIVDTSNEIGGDGDIPHPGVGRSRRMQVSKPEDQFHVMIEAVENHMPEVIVIDEIGTELECQAARTISQRGVQLIATAHGCQLENVMKNPSLQDLVGGITCVTLGDDEARKRGVQKSVLERKAPPVFDVCIEILDRSTCRIHHDLAEAVDNALAGGVGQGEIRSQDGDPLSRAGGRPLPPTLPVLPDIRLGTMSTAAERAVSEIETIASETASSAVPLGERTQSKPAGSGSLPSSRRQEPDVESTAKDMSHTASESEEIASTWFALGGLREGEDVVLTLFTFGVDVTLLWEVVNAMELGSKVALTPFLKDADAILGTKMSLKISGWVRDASRTSGIPLYPIKNCSASHLVRALHSLLGLQPSTSSVTLPDAKKKEKVEEPPVRHPQLSPAEKEALSEVKFAVEDVVLPRCQAFDLMPRFPSVIELQIQAVQEYNLKCDTVGSGKSMHLRIFPPEADPQNNGTLQGAVA